jgi:FkbM family methyltransferase
MKKLLYKIIYQPFINQILRNINKWLYPRFTKFRLQPSGCVRFTLNNGKEIKLYTNQTDYVSFLIFWEGLYEYEFVWIFEKLIHKCNGFLDIGANTGLFSLVASKNSLNTVSLAFEPSPDAHMFLKKNTHCNTISENVKIYELAVSNKETVLEFYKVHNPKYPDVPNLSGAASLVYAHTEHEKISVTTIRLDNFLKKNHPELVIDFVKIDAEGAEADIIQGMLETIETYKPIITCEILLNDIGQSIQDLLKSKGYNFYLPVSKDQLLKTDTIQYEKNADIRNIFCVPDEKLEWIKEFVKE